MTYKVKLDTSAKVITGVMTLLLGAGVIAPLFLPLSSWWITAICLGILIYVYAGAPVSVSLTDKAVVINKGFGRKVILLTDIERVERMTTPDLSWRLWASGGFMGYYGLFRTRTLGQYEAFIGIPSDSVLLMLCKGKPVIFSCQNPDQMVSELKLRINRK